MVREKEKIIDSYQAWTVTRYPSTNNTSAKPIKIGEQTDTETSEVGTFFNFSCN